MNKTLLKPTSKGQVTIPSAIRKRIGIDENSYLSVHSEGNQIIFKPVKIEESPALRDYTEKEIEEFLKNDQISSN